MADITLKIGFDEKEIDKEITTLEKKINSLGDKQLPLVQKLEEIKPKLKQAQAELDKVNKAWAEGKGDYGYGDALKKVQALNAEYDETYQQVVKIDAQLEPLYDKLAKVQMNPAGFEQAKSDVDKTTKSVGKLDKEVKNTGNSAKAMGSSFKSSTSSTNSMVADLSKRFDRLKKRIVNLALSALLFSALTRALTKVREAFGKALMSSDQFATSAKQIKGNLAIAFQPIFKTYMPILNKLMEALKQASAAFAEFINKWYGTTTEASEKEVEALKQAMKGVALYDDAIKDRQKQIKALEKQNKSLEKQQQKQREEIDAQTDALEKQIKALDKQADALKKSEDVMNAARQERRDALQENIDYIESEKSAVEKAKDAEQEQYDAQIKAVTKQEKAIQKQIKALQKKQKAEEAAAKANEKTLLSFDDLNVFSGPEEDTPTESEISALQEQLDLLGEQKDAIQEVADARAEAYDAQLTVFADKISVIQERIDAIQNVDFSDKISAYEEQITSLRDRIQEINDSYTENPLIAQNQDVIDAIQEQIDLLGEQKTAAEEAAAAMKNSIGESADSAENASEKVSGLKKTMDDFYKDNEWSESGKKEMSGFAKSAQGTVDGLKLTVNGFSDYVQGETTGNTEQMKLGIEEMAVGLGNALISTGEMFANMIIVGMNKLIDKINDSFSERFVKLIAIVMKPILEFLGIDVEEATEIGKIPHIAPVVYEKIPVPKLATGAVLPANKPFYAMLGDQKNGTNIEAPLETIKQALYEVMQNNQRQPLPPIVPKGELAPLIRMLKLGFEEEDERASAFAQYTNRLVNAG